MTKKSKNNYKQVYSIHWLSLFVVVEFEKIVQYIPRPCQDVMKMMNYFQLIQEKIHRNKDNKKNKKNSKNLFSLMCSSEIHRNMSTLFVNTCFHGNSSELVNTICSHYSIVLLFKKNKDNKIFQAHKFNARQMFKMITGNEDKFMYIEYNIIIYIHISVKGQ